jgi:hypothetical protein
MIRDTLGDTKYWTKWVEYSLTRLPKEWALIRSPSLNPLYDPQYTFDTALGTGRLLLRLYSAGAPVRDLLRHLPELLDAWELSNRLSDEICKQNHLTSCRDWDFSLSNLNHYNWCFWLVGLALALDDPDDHWQRLLALIGGEGQDVLLDRVIASRSPGRHIGNRLLHPKPYARLLRAVDAPKDQQPQALRDFVDHWYVELKRPPPKSPRAPTIEPFWYRYGDPATHPLEMGSYFGRWCIEAVAVVKAFGIDDSLCLGHEHYPGDLLRPDRPSTHRPRSEPAVSWWRRLLSKSR